MSKKSIQTTISVSMEKMGENKKLADDVSDLLKHVKMKTDMLTIEKISKRVERICDKYEYQS